MIRKAVQVFSAAEQAATVDGLLKPAHFAVQLSGTWTSLTVTFEATVNGTDWRTVELLPSTDLADTALVGTATAVGLFVTKMPLAVMAFRVRCSTWTSGTAPTATVRAA